MTWAARAGESSIVRPDRAQGARSSEWDGVEKLEVNKLDPDVGNGCQQEVTADEDVEQFHEAAHPTAEFAHSPVRGGGEGRGGRRVGVSAQRYSPSGRQVRRDRCAVCSGEGGSRAAGSRAHLL